MAGNDKDEEDKAVDAAVASASNAMNNPPAPVANETSGGSNNKGNPASDVAMGLGYKDRDASYYNRTANTIRRTQGEDAYQNYLNSYQYQNQTPRAGIFDTFLAGLGVPKMMGYKDEGDWYDGGGRYASGPRSSFGIVGGLLNAFTGNAAKERSYYDEVNQMIDSAQGAGAAKYLMENEPSVYQQVAKNAISALRGGATVPQPQAAPTTLLPTKPTPNGLSESLKPKVRPFQQIPDEGPVAEKTNANAQMLNDLTNPTFNMVKSPAPVSAPVQAVADKFGELDAYKAANQNAAKQVAEYLKTRGLTPQKVGPDEIRRLMDIYRRGGPTVDLFPSNPTSFRG